MACIPTWWKVGLVVYNDKKEEDEDTNLIDEHQAEMKRCDPQEARVVSCCSSGPGC
jgi:hypothetical protein